MAVQPLIYVVLLLVTLQGLESLSSFDIDRASIKRQLKLINKPAVKSFTTKHGEILDCVEIYKQRAFDNPLLKNHKIPLKYLNRSRDGFTSGQLLPNDMICPQGTVMVKRVTEEELAFDKKFSTTLLRPDILLSNSSTINDDPSSTGKKNYAFLQAPFDNIGTAGKISVWTEDVKNGQFSAAFIYVAGSDRSILQAGWVIQPAKYGDAEPRILEAWSMSQSGATIGCINYDCSGTTFVKLSDRNPLGSRLPSLSVFGDANQQHTLDLKIKRDDQTKEWDLYVGDDLVGYWPKEIIGDLVNGAIEAGWGGMIYTEGSDPSPGLGNGHEPEEGYTKACFINSLDLYGVDFPDYQNMMVLRTNECYQVAYRGVLIDPVDLGRTMFFGGAPGCWY